MTDKYTRLDSAFESMCAFWKAGDSSAANTGTLSVGEHGIVFKTSPEYKTGAALPSFSLGKGQSSDKVEALHGFTEAGPCTLFQVSELDRPGLTDYSTEIAITATTYRASCCVLGLHLSSLTEPCLNLARFTVSGISEWLPRATTEEWGSDHVFLKVPMSAMEMLAIQFPQGELKVKSYPQVASGPGPNERISSSKAYVEIKTNQPSSLSWILQVGSRLENLFSLILGCSLALETVSVYSQGKSGTVVARTNHEPELPNRSDAVRYTPGELSRSLSIWLDESDEFEFVENLVLGVLRKGTLFVETEFLTLAQALEGFHRVSVPPFHVDNATKRKLRRLIAEVLRKEAVEVAIAKRMCESLAHANEISFRSRLKELCEKLSAPLLASMRIDVDEFASEIITTKNFYTHLGGSLKRRKIKPKLGLELFPLNQRMRALLRALLLLRVGLAEEAISAVIVRDATRYE